MMEKKKVNYLRLIELQRKEKAFEESVLIADRCSKLASAMYVCFTLLKDFQEEFEEIFCSSVPQLNDLRRKSKVLEKSFDDYLKYLDKVWKFKSMVDKQVCIQVAEESNQAIREFTTTKGWGINGEKEFYGVNQDHLKMLINEINQKHKEETDRLHQKIDANRARIIRGEV